MLFELRRHEKSKMVRKEAALPGRTRPMSVAYAHAVNGAPLKAPYPVGMQKAVFALGCFWGAGTAVLEDARCVCDRPSATLRALRQTRPIRKCVPAKPVTRKRCLWSMIPGSSASLNCADCFGKATIRPRACGRATISAPSIVPAFIPIARNRRPLPPPLKTVMRRRSKRPGSVPLPRKSPRPRLSISRKATISNICTKTRTDIAV